MELKTLNVLKFVKLEGFVLVFTKTSHYNVLGQFNIFHAAKCTTCG